MSNGGSRRNGLGALHASSILVTGSHGFLGSAFARLLESRGIPFKRFDRNNWDLDHIDAEYVVHFAGITPSSAPSKPTYEDYFRANVESTQRLLDVLSASRRLTRFINIGSASEYQLTNETVAEDHAEEATSDYGRSKLAQSRLVQKFSEVTGVTAVNLRVFNVAGLRARRAPGSSPNVPTIFDSVIDQLETGDRVQLSHQDIVRDFVDVDDIMEAVFQTIVKPGLKGYQNINVATGVGTSLGRIVEITAGLLGREPKIVNTGKSSPASIGSTEKARRVLKWQAQFPIEATIRRLVGKRTRVLIVGAGTAGKALSRELAGASRSGLIVAGLVDDDVRKQNLRVGSVRVIGTTPDIPRLIRDLSVDQILLSTPSVGKEIATRIAQLVPPGFPIRVLPSIASVLLRKVPLSDVVRDIDVEDLVGRPLVRTDQKLISSKARGKTFLVTGGAGSIGSEIVRQLYNTEAKCVIVLDSWEEGIFNLLAELKSLKQERQRPKLITVLGNIRDKSRLDEVFKQHRIDVVVHAAAYKHVPLLEANPEEGRKTNVVGTRNVMDAARKRNVREFVLISTDKAVRPASVLGKTKRQAELLVKAYAKKHSKSRYLTVRFGNVLNSSGSVIPTFQRQIRNRQPVTITHPEMTRYFMSIPEAVSLVLLAWIVGKNGQVLVLDMGEQSRILDLALNLIRLNGLEPYKDIPIEIVGVRPGEKLHEELAYDGTLRKGPVERIFIAEEA